MNRSTREQLQTAVNLAAAAGDPTAGPLKAGTGDSLLRDLTRHFTSRAANLCFGREPARQGRDDVQAYDEQIPPPQKE